MVTDTVSDWLSAVTSALPVPGVGPAVNVAVETPLTKFVAPDNDPPTTLFHTAMKGGKPLSSVVKGPPIFRCLISAVKRAEEPLQICDSLELALSCRYVIGNSGPAILRKSFGPGPVLIPHQLSSAEKVPPSANRVSPFKGLGTVLPTNLEKVTEALLAELIAPPVTPAELPVREVVVTVSGPLSTMTAPPLPFGAELFENDELLML